MASHFPLAFIFLSEKHSVRNGCCYKANETSIMTIQFIEWVRKIPANFVYMQIRHSFGGWPWLVKFSFQHFSFPCHFPINITRAFIYSSFCKKLLFNKCTDSLWLTQNCLHLYSKDWYSRFFQNLTKCHQNTRHHIPEDLNLNCLMYFSFSDI